MDWPVNVWCIRKGNTCQRCINTYSWATAVETKKREKDYVFSTNGASFQMCTFWSILKAWQKLSPSWLSGAQCRLVSGWLTDYGFFPPPSPAHKLCKFSKLKPKWIGKWIKSKLDNGCTSWSKLYQWGPSSQSTVPGSTLNYCTLLYKHLAMTLLENWWCVNPNRDWVNFLCESLYESLCVYY